MSALLYLGRLAPSLSRLQRSNVSISSYPFHTTIDIRDILVIDIRIILSASHRFTLINHVQAVSPKSYRPGRRW
jgi:hypothetical protein